MRSPDRSSPSADAGCAVVCTISSACASWCPRDGYGGTVADDGGLNWRYAVVVADAGACGQSATDV